MKLSYALWALPVLFMLNVKGQQVDKQIALELYKKNSISLRLLGDRYKEQVSELYNYSIMHNPQLKYEREKIDAAGIEETEEIIFIEQKIDLLGQPFLKASAVSDEEEALELLYEQEKSGSLIGFEQSFNSLLLELKLFEVNRQTFEVINNAYNSAELRFNEGNLSGFELKRFSVARSNILKDLNDSKNKYLNSLGELFSEIYTVEELKQIYNSGLENISLKGEFEGEIFRWNLNEIQSGAIINRPDLKALKKIASGSSTRLTVEELSRFPELSLEGGYKKVSGIGEGYVLGISMELPLFNFNGNEIRKAEAQSRMADIRVIKKEKEILIECAAVYNKLVSLTDQLELFNESKMNQSILETATLLYSEGNISLLELIDAVESYRDYRSAYLKILCSYSNALCELNKVSGIIKTDF